MVYEEQNGATRGSIDDGIKFTTKARPTIDRALKVGQVLYWLEQASLSTIITLSWC